MVILALVISFLLVMSTAQAREHTFTGWSAVFHQTRFNPSEFGIHADAQVRTVPGWSGVQGILIRPGMMYHLDTRSNLTTGYAYVGRFNPVSKKSEGAEHRLWQQYIYNQKIKNTPFTHRLRLEQRWIPAVQDLGTNAYDFRMRLRYFNRTMLSLTGNAADFNKGVFVSLQNELLLGLYRKDMTARDIFDQNRLMLGVGYRASKKVDLELGYMNIFYKREAVSHFQSVLQLSLYTRLPVNL